MEVHRVTKVEKVERATMMMKVCSRMAAKDGMCL
jgi:hypothetical protein